MKISKIMKIINAISNRKSNVNYHLSEIEQNNVCNNNINCNKQEKSTLISNS